MNTFQVKSGAINITDPCYNKTTWCALFKQPAKNGTWEAEVETEESEGRVAHLRAYHTDHAIYSRPSDQLDSVGVDSGQMSIIDSGTYPEGEETGECGNFGDKERVPVSFYDECAKATLSEDMFGIVSKYGSGAVSSTGYGDGSYAVYVEKEGEEIVAVEIVFIDQEAEVCMNCVEELAECNEECE